ncbi:hypothetical protein [Streptomyces sp. NPDC046371]|uniref:hypothetical protein n=1 Tax=Streptomyces sp. NPDC046371 TaxID=3154916 RepID=UPI0033CFADB3
MDPVVSAPMTLRRRVPDVRDGAATGPAPGTDGEVAAAPDTEAATGTATDWTRTPAIQPKSTEPPGAAPARGAPGVTAAAADGETAEPPARVSTVAGA